MSKTQSKPAKPVRGRPRGSGRPPKLLKSVRVTVNLTPAEAKVLEGKALAAERTVTDYLRDLLSENKAI